VIAVEAKLWIDSMGELNERCRRTDSQSSREQAEMAKKLTFQVLAGVKYKARRIIREEQGTCSPQPLHDDAAKLLERYPCSTKNLLIL
jgi:hypothetical protein